MATQPDRSERSMIRADVVVLGKGSSGLAAVRALQESGANHILRERSPVLGGLTRTAEVVDFCSDYTGHFHRLRR